MGKIVYDDATGNLVSGLVWQFDLVSSKLFDQATVWATPSGDLRSDIGHVHDCPLSKKHCTGYLHRRIAIDLMGGGELSDFVPFSQDVIPIICKAFADRLQASGLTGFVAEAVIEIGCFQAILEPGKNLAAKDCNNPQLLHLDFRGNGGRSSRLKVYDAPNLCPHCREVQMVCDSCGCKNWPTCSNCNQWTLFLPNTPEYSHPKGFVVEGYPNDIDIVEGRDWDGSDFFMAGAHFVSDRAKRWMEETNTFPISFKPALLNIEAVEEKFKKRR